MAPPSSWHTSRLQGRNDTWEPETDCATALAEKLADQVTLHQRIHGGEQQSGHASKLEEQHKKVTLYQHEVAFDQHANPMHFRCRQLPT